MNLEEELKSFCDNLYEKEHLVIWSTTPILDKMKNFFSNCSEDINYLRYEKLEELVKSGKLHTIRRNLPIFKVGFKELQELAKFYKKVEKAGWLENIREIDSSHYNFKLRNSMEPREGRQLFFKNNFHFAISENTGILYTIEGFKKCVSPAYLLKFSRLLRDAETRCKKHPRFKNG